MPDAGRTRVPGRVLVHLRRSRDHVDRHYADPLELEVMARVAGLSKYHFHRLFTATYGITPAAYVSERRVERAQDLLRSANLTVTEVCHAVGFSSRFKEIVGESPRQFQQRWGADAPRVPGCFVLMWGLAERRPDATSEARACRNPASQEKRDDTTSL